FNHEKFRLEYSPGKDRLHAYKLSWNWASVGEDFRDYLARLRHELAVADADPWKQPGVTRVIEQRQGQKLIPAGNEFTGQRLARFIFAGAKTSLDIMDPYIGPELLDR